MESKEYLELDVRLKLTNLISAAEQVVPTSETCPLNKALKEYKLAVYDLEHNIRIRKIHRK